ncbi:hypothetical protein K439DRAFT_1613624 [Ramaria rubella]|nr:hypothetical protein K439DRAFT_1613624 [Ramaria rubella]
MTPQVTKRKRTLSQSSTSGSQINVPPSRSSDIYFEEGNIVLIAENVAFRVHRTQLVHHSEVFRDMLSLAHQPEKAEKFDGCPTIHLSDTSKDITSLFQTLYRHVDLNWAAFEHLSGVLRLSNKYLIESLRTAAIKEISELFPSRLHNYEHSPDLDGICHQSIGEVIKLAHEVCADILLPTAYYDLCRSSLSFIIELNLPQNAFHALIKGRELLSRRLVCFLMNNFLGENPEECLNLFKQAECTRHSCKIKWADVQYGVRQFFRFDEGILTPHPLDILDEIIGGWILEKTMCHKCQSIIINKMKKEKDDLWMALPEIFGLGSWDSLREAD